MNKNEEKDVSAEKFTLISKEVLVPVLLFSFMLAIYAPLDIYLSNKGYFFFPGTNMLGTMTVCFIAVIPACFLVLLIAKLAGNTTFRVIYGMFTGGIIGLYLQGNWDFTDYGAWNGDDIVWSGFRTQLFGFGTMWIALFIVCVFFSLKRFSRFKKITTFICSFIILILLYTLTVLLVREHGLAKEKEYIATTEEELKLSKNENMIVLVVDTFDGGAFYSLIEKNPEYRDIFEGFTFYRDTMGAYTSTDMSIPMIVTGHDYQNDVLFGDYLSEAYRTSNLINWLRTHAWETDIYTDMLVPQNNEEIGIYNLKKLLRVSSDNKTVTGYIYKMVLFRYLPQPLKRYFTFYPDNLKLEYCSFDSEDYTVYTEDNLAFRSMINELSAQKDAKVFQLIHIDGSHPPFYYTKDLKISEEETSFEDECEAMIGLMSELFDALKKKEAYDNTTIIIMGDHGYYNNRQNPLLLVKSKDAAHSLSISDDTVWFYDLQSAYIELLENRTDSENVFKNVSKEGRSRFVRSVPWNTHLNYDTYGGLMKEYASGYPAYTEEGFGFDGREFAPGTDESTVLR